jgi:hypothetical protein
MYHSYLARACVVILFVALGGCRTTQSSIRSSSPLRASSQCFEAVSRRLDEEEPVARYKFHPSARLHSYVGMLGDLDGVLRDVTGEDASRVQRKVRRAHEKFKVCPADNAAHLVLLELDRTIDLFHVAGALYGGSSTHGRGRATRAAGASPAARSRGGLHSRLGGLVVARRADRHRLFCGYEFTLFVNPGGALPLGSGGRESLWPRRLPEGIVR